jgi:hypothetical protein
MSSLQMGVGQSAMSDTVKKQPGGDPAGRGWRALIGSLIGVSLSRVPVAHLAHGVPLLVLMLTIGLSINAQKRWIPRTQALDLMHRRYCGVNKMSNGF